METKRLLINNREIIVEYKAGSKSINEEIQKSNMQLSCCLCHNNIADIRDNSVLLKVFDTDTYEDIPSNDPIMRYIRAKLGLGQPMCNSCRDQWEIEI